MAAVCSMIYMAFLAVFIPQCMALYSTTRRSPPGWNAPLEWYKEEIPNPQHDLDKCGRGGRKSWVCDPNNILSEQEASTIDEGIDRLRHATGGCHCEKRSKCPADVNYGGWQAGVAVLNKLRVPVYKPSRDELVDVAEDFADYLRDDSWEFGACDDDFVIVLSVQDRVVYTTTGDEMSGTLTDHCVDMITKSVSQEYFKDNRWAEGLIAMVSDYRGALSRQHKCNKSDSLTTAITLGVIGGLIAVIAVVVFFGRRLGCECQTSSGGLNSSSGLHSHGHNAHYESRRHSVSSNSSGGGGGTF